MVVAQLVLVVSSTLGVAQEAKSATGKIARLSEYRGRVVLLDFWATTCGGCIQEISMFIEVAKAYERRGLTTIGVSEDIAFAGPKYSHWSDLEQLPDLPELPELDLPHRIEEPWRRPLGYRRQHSG